MTDPNALSGEMPNTPLGHIREAAIGLLLDGSSGSWGAGPEGLTDRHVTYILSGEHVGQGGTFFLVDCEKSRFGIMVAMQQYSEFDVTEELIYDFSPGPQLISRTAHAIGPLTAVNYFDIDKGDLEELGEITLHTIDTQADEDALPLLLKHMQHDDLEEVVLGGSDPLYSWTKLDLNRKRLVADYEAFLRAAGDDEAVVKFAATNFGIARPEQDLSAAEQKMRVLPQIIRWLKGRVDQ